MEFRQMAANPTVGQGIVPVDDMRFTAQCYGAQREINYSGGGGGLSEIEEEFDAAIGPLEIIREELEGFGFPASLDGEEAVYVVVGKQNEETSMDALIWALNHALISSSTVVFLVHVFPETKHIPTPLGKLPISQVNPEQKESYMAQEGAKRRDHLQKFINLCTASQVKVDTVLIESDMEAKAILELIPVINIRKLVLGTTKSSLRRLRSKRGNGVTDQILQNAPEYCEVKIVCEGKEMSQFALESPSASPSPSPSPRATDSATNLALDRQPSSGAAKKGACGCFSIK